MPILGDPKFSRTLPLTMFERLQELLQRMKSTIGEGAILLTENLVSGAIADPDTQAQRFTVVASEPFSALLLGIPQAPEPLNGNNSQPILYQIGLTFELDAIATFLTQLAHESEHNPDVLNWLDLAQAVLQPNDAVIQSEFTLSLLEILSSTETNGSGLSDPIYPDLAVCKPVEEALRQQIEQEQLINQVTTQIRQSLELPIILKTAVEQVRHFLEVDRLLIYQFDLPATAVTTPFNSPLAEVKTESSTVPFSPQPVVSSSEQSWGRITYEAKATDAIASVLNRNEEECLVNLSSCREKYHQGLTFAVDDIETAYPNVSGLQSLLRQNQVRALLVAPIIVRNNLWGLLIAHQCFAPRQWKESEKRFLKQIAEHLTVAIHQAQLYSQLQQQKTTLEQRVIERTQELRDTLQAAQSANRAKSEFLAAMSHELRTPLTCVIGMSATLLRWSFGHQGAQEVPLHKQRRYLKTIQESGEHLLEVINDILDFSQVEAGKAVLNISEFSLSKLMHQTLRTLQEKASVQRINLEMDWRVKPQSDRFCADQRRVKQILFNLLGNAIKFTPEGGKVTLRVWREHNVAVFQIEDTGIGIPDEQLPLLFQKFQQLETPYHRNYQGTGLGLALTKQLVELHGGRIAVESVVDQGSLFTVWLPAQPLVSAYPTKVTRTQNNPPKPQGSIVLVENHEENATPICEILTAAGYQVVWLINGSTAVEQIKLLQPKAVIVDLQLLGIDGYEIIRDLRNTPATQPIKVLVLTTALPDDQEENLNIGVDDYLSKPVEPLQLLHKVIGLMGS